MRICPFEGGKKWSVSILLEFGAAKFKMRIETVHKKVCTHTNKDAVCLSLIKMFPKADALMML